MKRYNIIICFIISIISVFYIGGVLYLKDKQKYFVTDVTKNNEDDWADDISEEPADPNWKIPNETVEYKNEDFGITFRYPNLQKNITKLEGTETIILKGPQQKDDQNIRDGILIEISKKNLDGSTFNEFVSGFYSETKKSGISKVSELNKINVVGVSGYKFDETIVDTTERMFLPKGENECLTITIIAIDKNNKGFEAVKDKIVKSVQLL